jgi:hypothetical protein
LPAPDLTEKFCRRATAKAGKLTEYPDQKPRGLILRVSPAGAKTWAVRLRVAGKRPRIPLGDYPAVTLAEARAKARAILASNKRKAAPARAKSDPKPGPTKQGMEVLNTLSAILHERREAWHALSARIHRTGLSSSSQAERGGAWPENNWPEAEQRLFEAVEETRNSGRQNALLKAFGFLRGPGRPRGSTRLDTLVKAVELQISSEWCRIRGMPSMSPEQIVEAVEYPTVESPGTPAELEEEIENRMPEISRQLADKWAFPLPPNNSQQLADEEAKALADKSCSDTTPPQYPD